MLEEFDVRLLGTPLATIKQAEDRELFKQLLLDLGMEVPSAGQSRLWRTPKILPPG